MNQNTKDIAKILNCDLDIALQVQDAIDEDNLINWSEDSKKVIRTQVVFIARELSIVPMQNLTFNI